MADRTVPNDRERRSPSLAGRLKELVVGSSAAPLDLTDSNRLAVERTRLSHERTMMAWLRTGLSLISFGFTIYKFFQVQESGRPFEEGLIGSRGFAFFMILTGLFAVLLAGIQHRRQMQSLRAAGVEMPPSLAALVAVMVSILGILGLLAVVFRQ
ncbi:MAG: DUF202 domain-containing protein [Ectothiorhodospiraceae bacterium]|jgi:putative membrane protein